MVDGSINIKGVFMIEVPKRNDMYLKDFKKKLDFCLSYIITVVVDCCMLINKMMSC
jgi:hypothetical protein